MPLHHDLAVSGRERLAGLFADNVFRIPIRPTLVVLSRQFFMLAVRCTDRLSAAARSVDEVNVVSVASTRPGSLWVTS